MMNGATWTPESLGIRNKQNYQMWQDIERAFVYLEVNAGLTISGSLDGFLFELFRKRWKLACNNIYEQPLKAEIENQKPSIYQLLPETPTGIIQTKINGLQIKKQTAQFFKDFAADYSRKSFEEPQGKLYGYGTDGFGTYLPLHLLWPSLQKYWGIYISEAAVLNLAAGLFIQFSRRLIFANPEEESEKISLFLQLAYQIILRHQLFHFKVEQWTLFLELSSERTYYLPYLQYVYLPSLFDENDTNLEEAIANRSILLSKKILKIEKNLGLNVMSIIQTGFLSKQGPGYRNFYFDKGVPAYIKQYSNEIRYREVVNFLCNQIIQCEMNPLPPTLPFYLYPPNNNFLRAEDLCPIYLVHNLPAMAGIIS